MVCHLRSQNSGKLSSFYTKLKSSDRRTINGAVKYSFLRHKQIKETTRLENTSDNMRMKNVCKGPFVINRGSSILRAKPFAYVLKSLLRNERCDNCLHSTKVFKCSGCQYVAYCGRSCQKESWTIHKAECTNLKRMSPKIIPDAARLMARIIIKLTHGGRDDAGYYTDTKYRKFKDLMSHYTDIKKDEKRMEHFTSLCGVLFNFFDNMPITNYAELLGIYGRMCINSFNILDPDMHSIGVGIYLGPSIIDHSCKPNAVAVFEGTTIIIRTLEDLPSLDWSQMRISYIDLLNSTNDRRAELQNSYYFLCNCQRCTQPEPTAKAAACPNELCTFPRSPDLEICLSCNTKFPSGFKEEFEGVTELTHHHLQDMKTMAYLDVSKMCLKKQIGVLHKFNVQHVRTVEVAFDAAVNIGCYEEAELFAKELIDGYLLFYGKIHPLTGLLYLMIGKIQLYLEKPKLALESLKEACVILKITHGERHPVFKESVQPLFDQARKESKY